MGGGRIRLYLSPNPSHLEVVNPVLEGFDGFWHPINQLLEIRIPERELIKGLTATRSRAGIFELHGRDGKAGNWPQAFAQALDDIIS